MNIFIDEYGKIFCELKKGVYTAITEEYFKNIERMGLIKNIEVCLGGKNE